MSLNYPPLKRFEGYLSTDGRLHQDKITASKYQARLAMLPYVDQYTDFSTGPDVFFNFLNEQRQEILEYYRILTEIETMENEK